MFSTPRCPFCKSRFSPAIVSGTSFILECSCSSFPLVNGILYLKKDSLGKKAVELLKRGNEKKAFVALLNLRILLRLPFYLQAYKIGFKLFIRLLSYFSYDKNWTNYLLIRERLPSYFLSLSAINFLAQNRNSKLVELGCGVGQILKETYRKFKPENVFGVDRSVLNLFLCRTFFANAKTLLICCDLEKNLPFNDDVFQGVLMSDTFHYVRNKKLLMKEIERLTKVNGSCSIIHTLNTQRLRDIRGLSPESMERLVRSSGFNKVSIYSNETLWYLVNSNSEADLEHSDLSQRLENCYAYNTFISKKTLNNIKLKKPRHDLSKSVSFVNEPQLADDFHLRKIINYYHNFIFISPHLDDAVLSCGNLIGRIRNLGKKVTVLTIFTESSEPPYSPQANKFLKACGYKDPRRLFGVRDKEDRRAAKFMGFDYRHLNYPDAAWRRDDKNNFIYPNEDIQFSGKISDRDKKLVNELIGYLKKFANKKTLFFVPLGVGGHADHILVREAIEKLGRPALFWEDFPYNTESQAVKKFFRGNRIFIKIFEIVSKRQDKEKAIRIYKSQMKVLFPSKVIPDIPERYFVLE